MERTQPLQIDDELFFNYEKNVLRSSEEREYLEIHFTDGSTRSLFCQHRHHYGSYTMQDRQGTLTKINISELKSIEKKE